MTFQRSSFDVLMVDGTVHRVTINNRDKLRGEDVGHRHKWGPVDDSPIKYGTFFVYAAMVRTGQLPAGTSFDQFLDLHDDIGQVDTETVDPTSPATPGE